MRTHTSSSHCLEFCLHSTTHILSSFLHCSSVTLSEDTSHNTLHFPCLCQWLQLIHKMRSGVVTLAYHTQKEFVTLMDLTFLSRRFTSSAVPGALGLQLRLHTKSKWHSTFSDLNKDLLLSPPKGSCQRT